MRSRRTYRRALHRGRSGIAGHSSTVLFHQGANIRHRLPPVGDGASGCTRPERLVAAGILPTTFGESIDNHFLFGDNGLARSWRGRGNRGGYRLRGGRNRGDRCCREPRGRLVGSGGGHSGRRQEDWRQRWRNEHVGDLGSWQIRQRPSALHDEINDGAAHDHRQQNDPSGSHNSVYVNPFVRGLRSRPRFRIPPRNS